MGRLTPEREAQIREECRGRGLIQVHMVYELLIEIRALETERKALSDLLMQREKFWWKINEPYAIEAAGEKAVLSPHTGEYAPE